VVLKAPTYVDVIPPPPPLVNVDTPPATAAPAAPMAPARDGAPIPVPDPLAPPDPDPVRSTTAGTGDPVRSSVIDPAPPVVAPVELPPRPDEYRPVDEPPVPVTTFKPEYPEIARQAGVEGKLTVRVLVGKNGRVVDAFVVPGTSIPMLDEAAVTAARRWVFTPALVDNHPVMVWVSIPIWFHLH